MNKRINLLDHGYVEFVEAWGRGKQPLLSNAFERDHVDFERGIIEAARQSTQGTFRGWNVPDANGRTDADLLKYLYEHAHNTPFEFAGMVIEVQAPIMVFREWHRHRTQSYNEMSARYAPLPDLVYLPTVERIRRDGGKNKQAQSVTGMGISLVKADIARDRMRTLCRLAREEYEWQLAEGVPKELARGVLPFFQYSRMRASVNLRNWLAFMTLRADTAAQWEIQQFAHAVGLLLAEHFPYTWHLYSGELK